MLSARGLTELRYSPVSHKVGTFLVMLCNLCYMNCFQETDVPTAVCSFLFDELLKSENPFLKLRQITLGAVWLLPTS